MKAKIRVLDDITINKIAAGEVIENASSVVKELIENSLDAESEEITVEILGGGRLFIKISDDGEGMSKDDALLSLERHATSKIRAVEDFDHLQTLGFRGEALPSISSISKFSLLTSNTQETTLIQANGGKLVYCDSSQREKGTTIEIRDLFFNVPVRKKFLRAPQHDESDIVKIVQKEALARADVKFQLIINHNIKIFTPKSDFKSRLKLFYGEDILKDIIPIEGKESGYEVSGYIGKPSSHKSSKSMQNLFMNQRPVSSPLIGAWIREAFSTYIPNNRYPMFFLHINMPATDIDVNVHPQKKEIRLRHEPLLKKLIYKSVSDALGKERTPDPIDWAFQNLPELPWEKIEPAPAKEENVSYSQSHFSFQTENKICPKILTTIQGYIVTQSDDGSALNLIEQTRAHSRILFEKILKGKPHKDESEPLLIPIMISLSKNDCEIVKNNIEKFHAIGLEIREFGSGTFALDSLPLLYKKESIPLLVQNFVEELKKGNLEKQKESDARTHLAEKAAELSVAGDKILTFFEAENLLKELYLCEHPYESPSGKPIEIKLSRETIRLFQK